MRALASAAGCLLLATLSYAECVTVIGADSGVPTLHSSSRRIQFTALQDGKGLGNVRLIFYLKTGAVNSTLALTTDSHGAALVSDLAPGNYRILAIGPEHESAEVYLEVTNKRRKATNSFLLRIPPTFPPQKASDIDATPITEHIRELNGHVEDPSGAFVPGALVQVFRKDSQPIDAQAIPAAKIKADQDGSFAAALPPGEYVVFVQSPGFRTEIKGIEVRPGAEPKTLRILLRIGSTC